MKLNKKVIILCSVLGGVVIVAMVVAIMLLGNVINVEPITHSGDNNKKVEDFRDDMTEENFNEAVTESSLLDKYFVVTENQSNSMYRLSRTTFRVVNGWGYSGTSRSDNYDTFYANFKDGVGNNPDVGITLMTKDIPESEVENIVFDILDDVVSKEILDKLASMNYGDSEYLEVNIDDGYNDINITKSKDTQEYSNAEYDRKVMEIMQKDEPTEEELDYIDNPIYDIYTVYSYSVHFSVYTESEEEVYELAEYDRQLLSEIPIFSKAADYDVGHNMLIFPLADYLKCTDFQIQSYSASKDGDMYINTLTAAFALESGEEISAEFSVTYDDLSQLVYYTYTIPTAYFDSADEAFNKAIEFINTISGLNYTAENFDKEENAVSMGTVYQCNVVDHYGTSITVSEEPGVGYFGTISFM